MTKLQTLIQQFEYISQHPAEMMKKYKEETGKGAVGIMPVYAPEEIVHATGYLPIGLWGGQRSISKARTYLPPFACSIMQVIMEMQIEKVYDDLAAVIFSVPCDTLKCLSQKWKGSSPVIVFTHPQNRKLEVANVFLRREYEILRERLEKTLNVKISDEAIKKSIKVYNENRQVMREFVEAAALYPQIIDPVVRHAIIKSRWFMEKSAHTALVKELLVELRKEEAKPWDGKRVILTGIMTEPNEVLEIFKDEKFAIVADDLAQESRQYRVDVPEDIEDPLYALAKWWQIFDGCALATDPKKVRGQMLIDMAKDKKIKADAVVVCMMKFCDPEEFDYPIYYQEFEDADIKNIMIEIDLEMTAFEQIKTRIQSFNEMLA